MKNKSSIILYVFMWGLFGVAIIFMLICCGDGKKKKMSARELRTYEEPLRKVNRFLVQKDDAEIKDHCKRHAWDMELSPTNLWYGKLKETKGVKVKKGDWVELKYRVELLNGKVLYTSDSLGTKSFEVGHGGVESGLEEGLLMMREHEKFRFIMPPHQAHGLLGDLNKIPARSIIVYYVELLKVN